MFTTVIVPCSILIPIFLGISYFKSLDNGAKLLLYYLICSGLINLGGMTLVRFHKTNLPLLHLYTIVEAIFLLGYLSTLFRESVIRKSVQALMVIFPLACIINVVFFQSIYVFNTNTRPLEAILITFFCLLFFYKSGFTENWINKSSSWFNMGILFYFPVVCIIFILSNYMVFVGKNKAMNSIVWNLHAAMAMLMYLIWAKGFSLYKNGR